MEIFFTTKLKYLDSIDGINEVFRKAIELSIVEETDLPKIPNREYAPPPSKLLNSISQGDFSSRTASFTITNYAKRRLNSLMTFDDQGKFIELLPDSLNPDQTFTFCRSAKIEFNSDVLQFLKKFGKFHFYSFFDFFDLKIGTDLAKKIVVLNPEEYVLFNNEYQAIKRWNYSITHINNTVSRLKYRISERLDLKIKGKDL